MKKIWLNWWGLLLIPAAFLFLYGQTESYCFFYPGIDTKYAPGFSEQAFSEVATGMTAEAVQQKLGAPLSIQHHSKGDLWFYTLDAKCKWGDWAWLCRQVNIREGRVDEITSRVCYN